MYSTPTMITLAASKRTTESRNTLTAEEKIPAVYYSAGSDAVAIAISSKEFTKIFKEAGETTAVTLDIDGEKVTTLVHDIQRDPLSNNPIHVDFLIIDMKKEIEVPVPVEFEGIAEAEKNGIGTLVKVLHEVELRALPDKMPHAIHVDITSLATLDDQIHVRDIKLPAGVVMLTPEDEVVALITAFKEEKEEEIAIDLTAIDVEKKGKKDEDTPVSE